jgi:LuxR family maltose regulon positive regulatory protein
VVGSDDAGGGDRAHAGPTGEPRPATAPPDRPRDPLHGTPPTPAERRLLALLPGELSRREMGAELFVTVDTVKTHLRRLYRRLGVETRADAVEVARERGLLPR